MKRPTISIMALVCLLWTTNSYAQGISAPCEDRNQCGSGLTCIAGNCLPDGKLTVTLAWPNNTDLDLSVRTPSGALISPDIEADRRADGGELQRDECYNPDRCEDNSGHLNVEHVSWPVNAAIPEGNYEVFVTNHSGDEAASYEITYGRPDGGAETFAGAVPATEGATGPTHNFEGEDTICDADTDKDGICDKWEIEGIDINDDGLIDFDLPSWGVDPNHKDLFVEADWFTGEKVYPLGPVIAAFATAPVDNPDGTSGIKLHIQMDEEIRSLNGTAIAHGTEFDPAFMGFLKYGTAGESDGSNSCTDGWFGTAAERADANCEHIMKARKQIFRYAIFAHKMVGTHASGQAELAGNDIIVSSGYAEGLGLTQSIQNGVFMHELGHSLGLGHGSIDHNHCKPNHLSVMNYLYQNGGLYAGRPLAFGEKLPDLNEAALDEQVGVSGPSSWSQVAYVSPTGLRVTSTDASQPVDFNANGVLTDTVNQSVSSGFDPCPALESATTLAVGDEWSMLRLDFRTTAGWNSIFPNRYDLGDAIGTDVYASELSFEDYENMARQSDSDQDGLNNFDDNCATIVNPDQADADDDGVGDACDVCPDEPAPGYDNGCPEQPGDGPSNQNPDNETEVSATTASTASDEAPEYIPNGGGNILIEQRESNIESHPARPDQGCSTSAARLDGTLGLLVFAVFAVRRRRR